MADTMIERITAILADYGNDVLNGHGDRATTSANPNSAARRILAAMREPTDAMVEAGLDLGPGCDPERYFVAMIRAALAEGR